jgi:hypothetical protein
MIGPFDYQERISECARWAEKAANDRAREVWKEMERFWRQRAIWAYLQPDTPLQPGTPLDTDIPFEADASVGVSPDSGSRS